MAPTVPIEYIGRRELITCSENSVVMMGKARKFSKGPSSGFVSDYRVIETMAESEGFGSSGRVDTEMTASEGSYGPKRKSRNLNIDSYDRFGGPLQIISLSTLSPSEKINLEMRFKNELERVKLLQTRIASLQTNGSLFSPLSDIHSYSEGHRRPQMENLQMAEVSTSQGKKRSFPGKKGSRAKQPPVGRAATKQAPPSNTSNTMLMKQCENLLNKLMTHQHGWVFNTPVDVVKLNIPDYFDVIKYPMDLGTVKSRVLSGEYSSPLGFAADVRLTLSNAKTYNPVGNDVHIMADIVSKFFETRWKPIEKKVPIVIDAPVPSTSSVYVEPPKTYTPMPPAKKKKTMPTESKPKPPEPVKPPIPVVDKQKLSLELEELLAELPDNIIDFLKKQSDHSTQTDEDEIEIDIDSLSDVTLLELRKLLDNYLFDKRKKQVIAGPCEMELHNESGFSNSSVQPTQGNEPVDEDVDIGGNDPPISSYPPVQIEKEEITIRPDKRSSSSSSSGSSSSDSDSGSSSGSESDGEKAPGAAMSTKVLGPEGGIEQKTNDMGVSDNQDSVLGGSNQAEQNSEPKEETSVVAEGHQEGESAPLGRQVSPDKLYRAALLRSRFADTILKAQEKTLDKGEKQDPEKLRLEKEELERRGREEKARLQAEAKAAEEARRKAEADAAAEAKRKRDIEREAARLALQKMEKTVVINENCHFLEDLEMLRGGDAAEHVESLIDEASPDLSQNNMGSFKFQGSSNPLEQLGLYMKMDDDEDEEAEPQRTSSPDDTAIENKAESVRDTENTTQNETTKENDADADAEDGEID